MDYEKTMPFTGNTEKALDTAKNVLMQHSFQAIKLESSSLEFTSPNTIFTKGENPLLGASRILISSTSASLTIKADYATLRKTMKYMVIFLLGMTVFFLVGFSILFHNRPNYKWWISVLPLAPWPIIIPLMSRFMKNRTTRALDSLLNNIAAVGKQN